MYNNILDDIVNKYDNTYQSTIKMKPVGVKLNTYINTSKEINEKILNSKSVILLEYQNIKHFCKKAMFQIGLKKFLLLQKLKALYRGNMLLVILKAKKLLERFTKKNCKKNESKRV